jgi:hypothetical protein
MSGGGGGDNRMKETPEMREIAKISAEKWNFYNEKFAPIENWYIENVANMNTANEYRKAIGVANVEAQMTMGKGLQQFQQANPNNPRFVAGINKIEDIGGIVAGNAGSKAIAGQQNKAIQGMSNVAAMGMGRSTEAQQGMANLASNAEKQARFDAEKAWNERMSNLKLAGTAAGIGASVYANDLYQKQLAQNQAPSSLSTAPTGLQYGNNYGSGLYDFGDPQYFRTNPYGQVTG